MFGYERPVECHSRFRVIASWIADCSARSFETQASRLTISSRCSAVSARNHDGPVPAVQPEQWQGDGNALWRSVLDAVEARV